MAEQLAGHGIQRIRVRFQVFAKDIFDKLQHIEMQQPFEAGFAITEICCSKNRRAVQAESKRNVELLCSDFQIGEIKAVAEIAGQDVGLIRADNLPAAVQ